MEDDGEAGTGTRSAGAEAGASSPGRLWLGIIGVLLVAVAAVWIWKEIAVGDVRGEMRALEDSLVQVHDRALTDRTRELLRLSGVPLAWALRAELIRRDYDQVNSYLSEFVQEPGVEQILVGGPGDTILAATDKRLEGRRFSELLPAELLGLTDARVEAVEGGALRLAVPVLGPTRSLGVLVVRYEPPSAPGAPSAAARGEEGAAADTGR